MTNWCPLHWFFVGPPDYFPVYSLPSNPAEQVFHLPRQIPEPGLEREHAIILKLELSLGKIRGFEKCRSMPGWAKRSYSGTLAASYMNPPPFWTNFSQGFWPGIRRPENKWLDWSRGAVPKMSRLPPPGLPFWKNWVNPCPRRSKDLPSS